MSDINNNNKNDNDNDDTNNIFCDIIAQQQEFQLRQDQRANQSAANSLSSIRARTRQLELERELAEERSWRQDSSGRIDFGQLERKQQDRDRPNSSIGGGACSTNASHSNNYNESNINNNQTRRKFSLSYAMSSLTAFTATAMPSSSASNSEKQQPQARLEHQASLISSSDLSAARSRLLNSYDQHLRQQHQQQQSTSHLDNQHHPHNSTMNPVAGLAGGVSCSSAAGAASARATPLPDACVGGVDERSPSADSKKRGFVHKAIRRGSKMFDSMLLQSAQRQSEQHQSVKEHQAHNEVDHVTSNSSSSETTTSTDHLQQSASGKDHAHRGVQFAGHREDQNADEKATSDKTRPHARRRKLTLGSLPSDLRRALSFNTTGHNQQQNLNQSHSQKHNKKLASSSTVAPHKQLLSNKNQQRASIDEQQQQQLNYEELNDFTMLNNQHHHNQVEQPSKAHFKRKNSLLSALSSVNPAQLVKSRSEKEQQRQFAAYQAAQEQRDRDKSNKIELHRARMASNQNVSLSLCLDHSRTYKLIIYGSGAVGKTSLIQRFLYGHFPASHKPTVEELHSNKYNIPDVGEIYLEILDTSGTFEFPAMRRLSIEKGDAFILVFSVMDPASWQEVIHLRQMILEHKGESQMSSGAGANSAPGVEGTSGTGNKTGDQNLTNKQPGGAALNHSQQGNQISSIYAAATKLTSMQRRASCISGQLFSTPTPASVAGLPNTQTFGINSHDRNRSTGPINNRRLSVCGQNMFSREQLHDDEINPNNELSNADKCRPATSSAMCSPSSAHYNSQLSRLIQLAPVCDTSSKLLESGNSIDELQHDNINSISDDAINRSLRDKEHDDDEQDDGTRRSSNHSNEPDRVSAFKIRDHNLTPKTSQATNSSLLHNNDNSQSSDQASKSKTQTSGINKKGVAKRTVSMAPSANNNNLKSQPQSRLFSDLGIFKRTTTPIVVAANKCDTNPDEWLVDLEEAERLVCNDWGHSFVRCSAKEAQNTDRVFKELLRQAQAPPNLSESVIDDNQLRRQSLPVIKNQLSVSQMKGLRNLYNMHTGHPQTTSKSPNMANYQSKLSFKPSYNQNNITSNSNNSHQVSNQSSSDSGNQLQCSSTEPTSSLRANMGNRSTSSASDDSQCVIS